VRKLNKTRKQAADTVDMERDNGDESGRRGKRHPRDAAGEAGNAAAGD